MATRLTNSGKINSGTIKFELVDALPNSSDAKINIKKMKQFLVYDLKLYDFSGYMITNVQDKKVIYELSIVLQEKKSQKVDVINFSFFDVKSADVNKEIAGNVMGVKGTVTASTNNLAGVGYTVALDAAGANVTVIHVAP